MKEIDEAMGLIEETVRELACREHLIKEDRVVIRRQLEAIAKAARRETLVDAADHLRFYCDDRSAAYVRRMAEEAT